MEGLILPTCLYVEQYLFDQNQEGPFKIPSMSIMSFFPAHLKQKPCLLTT